ncbi:TetR/AcrR family transcriptional regulator C-terminal domain-containing protein [Kitasatospora sp. NBC_01287]|uniref:TetR/AcrR family transcriptional regulator C-terminal domain-containing protein n=1 Tax=Kitasatospora sp. NBC_01287 TaxID=2903573 RepID=UPI0022510EA5|nr:TetR/AcrR family transcriptional regulator C-terminal domain-containing protein [Kitasatospora sp. NBC_01287]MCX4748101.1 TetR/AcrR family transcriptional regulator C-terminal domain-containing protein [Kitasatospora sp. NBC_01287]
MADRRARPKAGLSRERVLEAALDLVDRHGLAALTMRKLGAELEVEAMTLYHHVRNKQALLDGLVSQVVRRAAAIELPADPAPGADWTPWARAFATGLRRELLRHPGVLPLVATHPLSSPADLDLLEGWLAALTAAGLPLGRALDLLNTLAVFVVGHALAEVGRTPGETEDAPDLDSVPLDPARYPLLAQVAATRAGLDFDARFERAVDILLAGYAADYAEGRPY